MWIQYSMSNIIILNIYPRQDFIVYVYASYMWGGVSHAFDVMFADKCYRNCSLFYISDIHYNPYTNDSMTADELLINLEQIDEYEGITAYRFKEILPDAIANIQLADRIHNVDVIEYVWSNIDVEFDRDNLHLIQTITGNHTKSARNILTAIA